VLKAVVFDRDGVLADFDLDRARAALGVTLPFGLEELGRRLRAFAARVAPPLDGPGERAFFGQFTAELGAELGLDDAGRARLGRFDPRVALVPYPDARGALERARARGLRTGVLSNFTLLDLGGSLAVLGLRDLVDAALSAATLGVAKPAPEAYRAIAAALGVAPSACLFVDDRPEHVAGAARVGMRALLLRRGAGAARDGVIESLAEIDRHLG
jgi:putative hydrolase of the HAD superfamily